MKKKDLTKLIGISIAFMMVLRRNENITTDGLVKICNEWKCGIEDIVEIVKEKSKFRSIRRYYDTK